MSRDERWQNPGAMLDRLGQHQGRMEKAVRRLARGETPAGAAAAYWRIATTLALADGDPLAFDTLSPSYAALRVVGRLRATALAACSLAVARFNDDATARYHGARTLTSSAGAATTDEIGATGLTVAGVPAASAPAGAWGTLDAWLVPYAGSGVMKAVTATSVWLEAAAAGGLKRMEAAGWWTAVDEDIFRVSLLPGGGGWAAGSQLWLYALAN